MPTGDVASHWQAAGRAGTVVSLEAPLLPSGKLLLWRRGSPCPSQLEGRDPSNFTPRVSENWVLCEIIPVSQ